MFGIGAARRILYGIPVAPQHGQAPVGIGAVTAPGSAETDLFPVIDERGTGGENIQVGRDLHPAAGSSQIACCPVCIMIGNERNVHGFRIFLVNGIQVFPGFLYQPVHVTGLGRFGNQPLGLGCGKPETVKSIQVPVSDPVTVPYLRDGVNVGIDFLQFSDIPCPESDILLMFPVVRIFGRIKAEPVDADIQPVCSHIQHSLPDPLVIEIQLRHAVGEIGLNQQVRLPDPHEMPAGRNLGVRFQPGVKVIPDIIRAMHQMGVFKIPEPGVIFPGMVQRQIQNQFDVPLMAQGNQFLQILLGPEGGINLIIIRHIIFMI